MNFNELQTWLKDVERYNTNRSPKMNIPSRECEFGKSSKAYKEGLKFIIDEEDYDKFVKDCYSYQISTTGGQVVNSINKSISRLVLGLDNPRMVVEHINGNKLDNRKSNLKIKNIKNVPFRPWGKPKVKI